MHKLSPGDLVIGNHKANHHYSLTRSGTSWVVIRTGKNRRNEDIIWVLERAIYERAREKGASFEYIHDCYMTFDVRTECFDYVQSLVSNKDNVHVLVKYDD